MKISVLSAWVRFDQCWLHGYLEGTDIGFWEVDVAALGQDDGGHEYEFLLDGDRRSMDPDANVPEFRRTGRDRGVHGESEYHGGGLLIDEVKGDSNGDFVQRSRDPNMAKHTRGFADQPSSPCRWDDLSQQLPGDFRMAQAVGCFAAHPEQKEPDRVIVSDGLAALQTQHRVVVAVKDGLSFAAPAPPTLRARCD